MENSDVLWAAREVAALDPPVDWEPSAAVALARLHARPGPVRARLAGWPLWTAAVLLAAVALAPRSRAFAQHLWQSLTVRPLAFVRVNEWPEGAPSPQIKLLGLPIPPLPAKDLDQVRARVRYEPRMPVGVLEGSPKLYTTFPFAAGTVVKVADFELALRKAGLRGLSVPAQWEGAQVALHTSGIAIAQWPDVALVQSLPLTLTAPEGFDFPAFSTIVLRILGVNEAEAARLAADAGTVPPWLVPMSRGMLPGASLEEVQVGGVTGTLLREPGRNSVMWTVPDRVYLMTGAVSRELMLAAANGVR
jgi:hypothetical protein